MIPGIRGRRFLAIVLLSVGVPACGGGGGGGYSAGPNTAPSVFLPTPAGLKSEVVSIPYSILDPESHPVSVAVEVSADGGATWAPATPAEGCEPRTGLASSPGGSGHVFLWDSEIDGIALGTVHLTTPLPGAPNAQVRVRITPSDAAAGVAVSSGVFTVDNTFERVVGTVTALFPMTTMQVRTSETAIGNLVADALRLRTGVQIALQNGAGIQSGLPSVFLPANTALRRPGAGYAAGPPYDITAGDVAQVLFFRNLAVTRTVTGSQLWAMLEHGVSSYPAASAGFPQISGFSFTFSQSAPVGSRVLSVTLDGGAPILEDGATYTFATNEFVNGGGDGYSMLNDGTGTPRQPVERVVADYFRSAGPLSPSLSGRITPMP